MPAHLYFRCLPSALRCPPGLLERRKKNGGEKESRGEETGARREDKEEGKRGREGKPGRENWSEEESRGGKTKARERAWTRRKTKAGEKTRMRREAKARGRAWTRRENRGRKDHKREEARKTKEGSPKRSCPLTINKWSGKNFSYFPYQLTCSRTSLVRYFFTVTGLSFSTLPLATVIVTRFLSFSAKG